MDKNVFRTNNILILQNDKFNLKIIIFMICFYFLEKHIVKNTLLFAEVAASLRPCVRYASAYILCMMNPSPHDANYANIAIW